jgi:HEPN domain-containing protein
MSDPTDPLAWVGRAEEDPLLARSSLRRKTPLAYGACFHAQQCVEKYLKAALVSRGRAFPKTHDLIALRDLCSHAGVVLPVADDQLELTQRPQPATIPPIAYHSDCEQGE